jgi:uncharacterized protein YdaT
MPWNKSNIPDSFKNLNGDALDKAISIANGVLKRCMNNGGTDEECSALAIRIALSKVKEPEMNEAAVDTATTTVAEDKAISAAIQEDLNLSVSLVESEIKEEDGVVKAPAVLIEQGWSLNNRFYSSGLLHKLASVLEGAGSLNGHLEHPSVSDYNGVYRGVAFKEKAGPTGRDAVVGTFCAIEPHMQRLVRHAPHLVKLSINGKGSVRRGLAEGREGWIVEDIDRDEPWTCDTVFRAGARGGIGAVLEAFEQGDNMDITSLHDLKKAFPGLLSEFAAEVKNEAATEIREQGEFEELRASLKEANDELARAVKEKEAAEHRTKVLESRDLLLRKLAEAKLQDVLAKRVLRDFENKIAEEESIDAAISEAQEIAAAFSASSVSVDGVKEPKDVLEEQVSNDLDLLRRAGLLIEDGE